MRCWSLRECVRSTWRGSADLCLASGSRTGSTSGKGCGCWVWGTSVNSTERRSSGLDHFHQSRWSSLCFFRTCCGSGRCDCRSCHPSRTKSCRNSWDQLWRLSRSDSAHWRYHRSLRGSLAKSTLVCSSSASLAKAHMWLRSRNCWRRADFASFWTQWRIQPNSPILFPSSHH